MNQRHFTSAADAADALHQELLGALGKGLVMLAGGTTPLAVYRRIAREAGAAPQLQEAAKDTWLVLSDDRFVPVDDERSNFGQILPMATALGIPEERFLHVKPHLPLDEAVAQFNHRLANIADTLLPCHLGILGIGEDGHTASLFHRSQVNLQESPGRWAMATGTHGGVPRVSLTAPALLAFERLIFFATGENKREILSSLQRTPQLYPAGIILAEHRNAEVWTDVGTSEEHTRSTTSD